MEEEKSDMEGTFFEARNITKTFGALKALDNFSININRGEIVGLIGPNGAGKTTFFNTITGVLEPDSGEVIFKDERIEGKSVHETARKGIGRSFQIARSIPSLPVIANVLLPTFAQEEGGENETATMEALEFVGIGDLMLEEASKLTHGELKLLDLAKLLVQGPDLFLLDEPFSGLNPSEIEHIKELFEDLREKEKVGSLKFKDPSFLIVEHKLSDLMEIVDRVVVLNFGEKLAEGTPEEVSQNEEVIDAYLGAELD